MNILYKNEAVSSLLKKEKLSEKNILTILPDDLKKLIIETLNAGNQVHNLDVKVGDKIFSYSISPVKENQYVNLYAIDITDRKKAEDELQRHREQLMEMVNERTSELQNLNEMLEREIAERTRVEAESIHTSHLVALGELAAGVAHEINNPINGIINYAQMLANKIPQGSKEQDVACRVIKESNRIANIVNSLLSFSRAVNTVKERVRIPDIMSDTLALTQAQIRHDGINLNVDIPENIPAILGHLQQIEQVFLNIISNARHALNQKYPGADKNKILNITAKEVSVHNKSYVEISFYDSGHGIQARLLDKIMNPFFTSKPRGVGTGLGLSISHGIINDHNGRILVDSVEGEFTKIIIELPVYR
jgi:signal transduction histidine kinase